MTGGPERPGRAIRRFAAWAAFGYSLLLAAPLLWWADGLASVAGALIAATWSASPAYGAALFAIASVDRGGAAFYLGIEFLVMAWFGWVWFDVSVLHPSSTGGLAFITLPVLQWVALILVAVLAGLLGWRARRNWPDPPGG